MLNWSEIETVLLDMDGTLLDLHFDNHFWMEYLPQKLSERDGLSIAEYKTKLEQEYKRLHGTLEWYCLDYWSEKLNMDIVATKREIQHLISMRDDVPEFLDLLHKTGRKVVLLTNAHPDSLSLKVERTQLDIHIDTLISTHEFGVTKESQLLWQKVHQRLQFDPQTTLFVDDSINILQSAQQFGIKHLLAISNPDSKKPERQITEFPAISEYRSLFEKIRHQSLN